MSPLEGQKKKSLKLLSIFWLDILQSFTFYLDASASLRPRIYNITVIGCFSQKIKGDSQIHKYVDKLHPLTGIIIFPFP